LTADGLGWLASLARPEHKWRAAPAQGSGYAHDRRVVFHGRTKQAVDRRPDFSEILFFEKQPRASCKRFGRRDRPAQPPSVFSTMSNIESRI